MSGEFERSNPPPRQRLIPTKHGLNPIRKRVMVEGLEAIDQRTGAARALLEWRRDLVADLGGEAAVTAQQRALVEMAARTKLYVDHLDSFLMQQRSLINKTKRTALPVLLQRQALADSLAKHLNMLGLERRARPVPSLDEYLSKTYATEAPEASEAPVGGTAGGQAPLAGGVQAQLGVEEGNTAEREEEK